MNYVDKYRNLKVFLPGTEKQFSHLLKNVDLTGKTILIIGHGSEDIAGVMLNHSEDISIILNEQNTLVSSRYRLKDEKRVKVKMMDYMNTDYAEDQFDLVYAQASITVTERNKIVKEIKRILKPEGIFSVGEIVSPREDVPAFVTDMWKSSGLSPLSGSQIKNYYKGKNFELISEEDLTDTLREYYKRGKELIRTKIKFLSDEEAAFNQKLINRMKHETNVYLKLGGDKYIGFKSLIMRKQS
jgi:ubiquinone/menaquinone biosynthesis C-methylase UbiE